LFLVNSFEYLAAELNYNMTESEYFICWIKEGSSVQFVHNSEHDVLFFNKTFITYIKEKDFYPSPVIAI